MCEVTRTNFEDLYPKIIDAIHQSAFVAIDAEFTGIKGEKLSLFDTSQDRYKKMKSVVKDIIPCQIGIAAFVDMKDKSMYQVHSFNIYLFPASFGPVDHRFVCQASSLEWLCRYDFDFNKFVYEGVSFINSSDEAELRSNLSSNDMFGGLDRDIDEILLQNHCSEVAEWIVNAKEGDSQEFDIDGLSPYVLVIELKQRFPHAWPQIENEKILIEKVSKEKRVQLESEEVNYKYDEKKKLVNKVLGFTRVFRELVKTRKPIVGHNMFMDLLLMYDKFHEPLPEKWSDYKKNVHELFPTIFDTKHISNKLRRPLEEKDLYQSTNLSELFKSLQSNKARQFALFSPTSKHANGFTRYCIEHKPHEAGYDAFMAGSVFLSLSHIYSMKDVVSSQATPTSFRQYITNMEIFKNCVNLIRASVNHTNLNGPDPETLRPEWLVIKSKYFNKKINTAELARYLSRFGAVDIRPSGSRQAFVAAGNHRCSKDIMKSLSNHEWLRVSKYSIWKHSPVVKGLLWSSIIVSGSLCMFALISGNKKR